jgi:hypothetical protein
MKGDLSATKRRGKKYRRFGNKAEIFNEQGERVPRKWEYKAVHRRSKYGKA